MQVVSGREQAGEPREACLEEAVNHGHWFMLSWNKVHKHESERGQHYFPSPVTSPPQMMFFHAPYLGRTQTNGTKGQCHHKMTNYL